MISHIRQKVRTKNVSISDYEIHTETVSHTIAESYLARVGRRHSERINNYTVCFENGKNWRIPIDNYLWSTERPMSAFAIYQSTHREDTLFVVTEKGTGVPVMAYPAAFFAYKG